MSEYYPADSVIHRLDPRTKFFMFAGLIALVMLIQDPVLVFVVMLSTLMLFKLAKIPLHRVKGMIISVIPVIILFIILNIFVVPSAKATIIGFIGPYPVALESVLMGLTGGFRFATFVFYSRLLTMTTDIGSLVSSLVKLKMPPEVAVALGIGFSSVGLLIEQLNSVKEAQMCRGAPIESKNPVVKAAALLSVVVPGVYLTILRGMDIAKVLESRAFTYNPAGRTFRKIVRLKTADYTIILAVISIVTTVALITTVQPLGYTFSYKIVQHILLGP